MAPARPLTFLAVVGISTSLALAGCGDGGSGGGAAALGTPFVPGHGVRVLQEVAVPNDGTPKALLTADVSISAPGRLEWVYGLATSFGSPQLSRVTLDLTTGQVLDDKGSLKGIPPASLLLEGGIKFVPYTNRLYAVTANPQGGGYSVGGEIDFGGVGSDLGRPFRAYANGDALAGSKGGYYEQADGRLLSDWSGTYRPEGAREASKFLFRHPASPAPQDQAKLYRAAAFERVPGGGVIALAVSGEAIVARRMADDGVELARVPYDDLAAPYRAFIVPKQMRSRLSSDGRRIACMLMDSDFAGAPLRVTTFTYDTATKQIAVVLRALVPDGLTASFAETATFDLDGNLIFGANVDPVATTGLKIVKQSASAQQTLASGFLPDQAFTGLQFMSEIDGKVFLAFSGHVGVADRTKVDSGPRAVLGVID